MRFATQWKKYEVTMRTKINGCNGGTGTARRCQGLAIVPALAGFLREGQSARTIFTLGDAGYAIFFEGDGNNQVARSTGTITGNTLTSDPPPLA